MCLKIVGNYINNTRSCGVVQLLAMLGLEIGVYKRFHLSTSQKIYMDFFKFQNYLSISTLFATPSESCNLLFHLPSTQRQHICPVLDLSMLYNCKVGYCRM